MSETPEQKLHKEFELERMILFSDAVFAIAITLLIIEIKFPEMHDGEHADLMAQFKPVILEASAFLVSFCFIGVSWVTHLKLFRFLRDYDNGIIARNLVTLFFIVTFPFSASGITHYRPGFPLPMLIYFGNVMLVFVANFLIAYYIFKKRPSLAIPGFEAEKKYLYMRNRTLAILMPLAFLIVLLTAIFTHNDDTAITRSFTLVAVLLAIVNARIRKLKPRNASKV